MRIAAIQLSVDSEQDMSQRLQNVDSILQNIANGSQKPDLILLPEIWGCGFFDFEAYSANAEPLRGPSFSLLSKWAKAIGCSILGGSIIERDNGQLYNTSLFIDRQGELIGTYRKVHLFGYQSREQQLLTQGTAPVVLDTDFGKVGLSTCYDLRFPEQYRAMVDQGAELFLVVSAWPEARLPHWRLFNQARATENQCWLVSCNCAGTQNGSRYAGHSMAVNPAGEIVSEADIEPCVQWSEIDMGQVAKVRASFPALADRV